MAKGLKAAEAKDSSLSLSRPRPTCRLPKAFTASPAGSRTESHTSGAVKITKQGTGFHLEWTYGDGDKFEGRGKLADNILVLKGSENGWDKDAVIAYALASDGVLAGLYANGTGQEKLTPEGWKPSPSADATPQDDKPGPGSASQASADQPTQTQGSAMKAQPQNLVHGRQSRPTATGGWGYAVGQPSRDEARNAALKDCGGSGLQDSRRPANPAASPTSRADKAVTGISTGSAPTKATYRTTL